MNSICIQCVEYKDVGLSISEKWCPKNGRNGTLCTALVFDIGKTLLAYRGPDDLSAVLRQRPKLIGRLGPS